MINSEFNFDKSFQEVLYRIDNWINEGFGWKIESINGEYVNISMYNLLVVKLPNELKNSKNGLINIKSNDNKCFLWCHIRHLNLISKNPNRITKENKKLVTSLNYEGNEFPVSRKDYCKLKNKTILLLSVLF